MTEYEIVKSNLQKIQYKWLITGVAGFIGSNLLETLLQLDQIVIGLDNFATGFKKNIDDVLEKVGPNKANNFSFYDGDICDLEACKKATQSVDFVLHQAALGSVPRSILRPDLTNATNVAGFVNIILAAKEANVKRFIYASSSSVYGDSQVLPKVESSIGNPISPYAVSKYTNELYAKAFANCYGLETIGLRYFNIFGPRQNPTGPYAAVIPLWILSLIENDIVYINGDGETSRDFCYVENAVQANLLAALVTKDTAINKVYNVTFGEATTLNQLFNMISSQLGVLNKSPVYREFRQGDIKHSLADISQANQLLNYSPMFNISKGLKQTVDWFCNRASN